MAVNKYRQRASDDLSVFISLATAIGILVSAAATMWLWSVIPQGLETVIFERVSEIP